ncbi:MAG: rod shape-determining protein MreD [Betaproteobacteria bacterium]
MQPTFSSSRILQPVRPWFVYATLFAALMLNLLPTSDWSWMPDWIALVLCFWSVREFRRIGMGWAFLLGIVMDVANSAALGQHALAYVVLAYLATAIARRILWFPLLQQALHILPLLLLAEFSQVVIRMMSGAGFPGFEYFIGPLIATALWIPCTYLLLLPQYRPVEQDPHRPI